MFLFKILANLKNRPSTISAFAKNLKSGGEGAISNGAVVAEALKKNPDIVRADIGGNGAPISPKIIAAFKEAVQDLRTYNYFTSFLPEAREALADFGNTYTKSSQFTPEHTFHLPGPAKTGHAYFSQLINGTVLSPFPHYNTMRTGVISSHNNQFDTIDISEGGFDAYIDEIEKRIDDQSIQAIMLASPDNPTSQCLSEGQAKRLGQILKDNPTIHCYLDAAYLGYEKDPSHDPLVYAGSYDDPNPEAIRLKVVSPSKLMNHAGRSNGLVFTNPKTIEKFLDPLIKATVSGVAFPNQKALPILVEYAKTEGQEYPKMWTEYQDLLTRQCSEANVESFGIKTIPYQSPPFMSFDISQLLIKYEMTATQFQHHALMNGASVLCGGFGENSDHIMRWSVSGMTAKETAEAFFINFKKGLDDLENRQSYKAEKTLIIGAGPVGQTRFQREARENENVIINSDHYKGADIPTEKISKTTDLSSLEKPDKIYVCTQAGDDPKTIARLKECVGPDTLIIVDRNGIGSEKAIAEAFPENAVARTIISVQIKEDGSIPKEIGWEIGLSSHCRLAADKTETALAKLADIAHNQNTYDDYAGVSIVKNIDDLAWQKYYKNQANAGSWFLSLTNTEDRKTEYQDVNTDETATKLMQKLTEEAVLVRDQVAVNDESKETTTLEDLHTKNHAYANTNHTPTTQQNFEKGLPIENIWGDILSIAGDPDTVPLHKSLDTLIRLWNDYLHQDGGDKSMAGFKCLAPVLEALETLEDVLSK